jgi:hypothetical protein
MRQWHRRHQPWTDNELVALKGLAESRSLAEIAELLLRGRREVRDMARRLHISWGEAREKASEVS